MRRRSLLLLLLAAATALALRRRPAREYVEIGYDDGSSVQLTGGVESNDLLRDAREIVAAAGR